MQKNIKYRILFFMLGIGICSCTSLNITRYYAKNQHKLDSIHETFKKANKQKHFSIEFTDRPFKRVSLELMTDTLTYIYEFGVDEKRMRDTLEKFGFDFPAIASLISQMQSLECTWVNQLDYYGEEQKYSLISVSLWPRGFNLPFVNKKYYILAYFPQRQYFDKKGTLLTGRRRKRIRQINSEIFTKLSDTVCYTLSDRFR
ncbi:hypothetical protein ACX0G9_00300 [Flavitalea flava]